MSLYINTGRGRSPATVAQVGTVMALGIGMCGLNKLKKPQALLQNEPENSTQQTNQLSNQTTEEINMSGLKDATNPTNPTGNNNQIPRDSVFGGQQLVRSTSTPAPASDGGSGAASDTTSKPFYKDPVFIGTLTGLALGTIGTGLATSFALAPTALGGVIGAGIGAGVGYAYKKSAFSRTWNALKQAGQTAKQTVKSTASAAKKFATKPTTIGALSVGALGAIGTGLANSFALAPTAAGGVIGMTLGGFGGYIYDRLKHASSSSSHASDLTT